MKTMSVLRALLRILQEVTFVPNLGSFLPLQLKVSIQNKRCEYWTRNEVLQKLDNKMIDTYKKVNFVSKFLHALNANHRSFRCHDRILFPNHSSKVMQWVLFMIQNVRFSARIEYARDV